MTVPKITVNTGFGGTRETIDWNKYTNKGARNYSGEDLEENAYADSIAEQTAKEILDRFSTEPAFTKRLALAIGKKVLL